MVSTCFPGKVEIALADIPSKLTWLTFYHHVILLLILKSLSLFSRLLVLLGFQRNLQFKNIGCGRIKISVLTDKVELSE